MSSQPLITKGLIRVENVSSLDDIDALMVVREIMTGGSKPNVPIPIFGRVVYADLRKDRNGERIFHILDWDK